ncbi:MAG: PadR family transcriptional regulator [Streptosporangiaceae bacterium]
MLMSNVMEKEAGMGNDKAELLQGTLDLLILKALALGEMHGFGIAQRLQQMSRQVLQVGQGSLYPALRRLEQQGWIRSSWAASANNRRARYYRLTRSGERQLERAATQWERLAAAVSGIVAARSL